MKFFSYVPGLPFNLSNVENVTFEGWTPFHVQEDGLQIIINFQQTGCHIRQSTFKTYWMKSCPLKCIQSGEGQAWTDGHLFFMDLVFVIMCSLDSSSVLKGAHMLFLAHVTNLFFFIVFFKLFFFSFFLLIDNCSEQDEFFTKCYPYASAANVPFS